jgi:serine/threonine-protein kinase
MAEHDQEPIPEFEGYQAVALLRAGPVADLYEAVQRPLGRRVLIKALSSSILPSSPFAATLEREARLLAEMDHPNILHLFDFVRTGERMWLVLEHVEGVTLDVLLQRSVRLTPAAACAVALELARALDHAHSHGIVHRDVQPRNVLLSRRGHVKLINFAVAVDERLPTAPELLDGSTAYGGPAYMSPEQILGEAADPRSDVFSLGVVLYEALAGRRPFDAPDQRSATQRIRHDAPPPLGRAVPGLPGALERTVQRCLEKMPSERFHTTAELVTALKRLLEGLDEGTPHQLIADQLGAVGLGLREPPSESEASTSLAAPQPLAIWKGAVGLAVLAALAVLGGLFIQFGLPHRQEAGARGHTPRLELAPKDGAWLRVVAQPWAHVDVDGQRVDTTPFARSIPLAPGRHYVRLSHPNAPDERRTIDVTPGETLLLDVQMMIALPPEPDAGINEAPAPSASAGHGDAGVVPSP